MPKLIKNSKLALIGLIIFFAVSIVMAGGGIPKIEPVNAQLRIITEVEQKTINEQYRSTIDLSKYEGKQWYNFRLFVESPKKWGEVERVALLKKLFPKVIFYKGIVFASWPPGIFAMAEYNGKFYQLPSEFNRLIIDNGLQIDEKNIIDFAKAFVITALIEKRAKSSKERTDIELAIFPQITFLEGKRIKEERKIGKKKNITYTAQLKVKVGDEIKNWHLPQDIYKKSQFGGATVTDKDGKVIKIYQLQIIETNQKQGGLDLNPGIEIETGTANSNAYVEWEDAIPHYYLIVESNGQPTNYKVKFNLTGFDTCAPNVYIRVRDSILHQNIALMHIEINNGGSGDTIWIPGTGSTGIYWVTAEHADDTNPEITYQPATSSKELTLEKVITGSFNPTESYKIYFCHQFFVSHDSGTTHAPIFAERVENALLESWQKQIFEINYNKSLLRDFLFSKSLLTLVLEDVIL